MSGRPKSKPTRVDGERLRVQDPGMESVPGGKTGALANAWWDGNAAALQTEMARLRAGLHLGRSLGLRTHAGHGLALSSDLPAEREGEVDREVRLAGRGRPDDGDDEPAGHRCCSPARVVTAHSASPPNTCEANRRLPSRLKA